MIAAAQPWSELDDFQQNDKAVAHIVNYDFSQFWNLAVCCSGTIRPIVLCFELMTSGMELDISEKFGQISHGSDVQAKTWTHNL